MARAITIARNSGSSHHFPAQTQKEKMSSFWSLKAGFAPTVDPETKILEHLVLFGKQSKEAQEGEWGRLLGEQVTAAGVGINQSC